MKRSSTGLLQIASILFTVAFGWIILTAVTDDGPGLSMMSAGPNERVSSRYLAKSVTGPAPGGEVYGNGGFENGSANIVTSVVVDYRMFDTFGEILVLFASAAGVALLMQERKRNLQREASSIVKTSVPVIMLFAIIVGFYIIVHGHLTPGGGFPGGAVLASAFILQFLAFNRKPRSGAFKAAESLAGLGLLGVGLAGLFLEGSFFANFLGTGIVGSLFSAGTTAILYTLIGIKVAAELSALGGGFIGE